ncbi:double stranded RNA-specific editase B [Pycnococcus provasolii]
MPAGIPSAVAASLTVAPAALTVAPASAASVPRAPPSPPPPNKNNKEERILGGGPFQGRYVEKPRVTSSLLADGISIIVKALRRTLVSLNSSSSGDDACDEPRVSEHINVVSAFVLLVNGNGNGTMSSGNNPRTDSECKPPPQAQADAHTSDAAASSASCSPCSHQSNHEWEVYVLSYGEGTKFVQAHGSGSGSPDDDGSVVRDMHAEVLARRSLKRLLLLSHLEPLRNKDHANIIHHLHFTSDQQRILDAARLTCKPLNATLPSNWWYNLNNKLVMYTSTAPCGNACVRRWVKPRKDVRFEGLPTNAELEPHVFDIANRPTQTNMFGSWREGEIASLAKGGCTTTMPKHVAKWMPTGLSPSCAMSQPILSCSDKIATWSRVGIQGSLLANTLAAPIRLHAVVIGRKFDRASCRRALSLRLAGNIKGLPPMTTLDNDAHAHPVLLGSSVPLTNNATETIAHDDRVMFDADTPCCWWHAGRVVELSPIDSRTGLAPDGSETDVSPRALLRLFERIGGKHDGGSGGGGVETFRERKRRLKSATHANMKREALDRLAACWRNTL